MLNWDLNNINRIAKHDVLPDEVEQAIRNGTLEIEQQTRNNEPRVCFLGRTDSGRVLFIVLTDEPVPRTVMARKADRRETRFYTTVMANRYGKGNDNT